MTAPTVLFIIEEPMLEVGRSETDFPPDINAPPMGVVIGTSASPKAEPYLKAGTLRASLTISATLGVKDRIAYPKKN